jgi:hypothetical protein
MAGARVRERRKNAPAAISATLTKPVRPRLCDAVELRDKASGMKVEPVEIAKLEIRRPIAAITPANRHEEISFGRPVGRELFS